MNRFPLLSTQVLSHSNNYTSLSIKLNHSQTLLLQFNHKYSTKLTELSEISITNMSTDPKNKEKNEQEQQPKVKKEKKKKKAKQRELQKDKHKWLLKLQNNLQNQNHIKDQ